MANDCEKIRQARLIWLGHVGRKTEEDVVMRTWKMEVGVCMYVYLFIRHVYIHKLYNGNENDYIRLKYPVQ